jgi:hypothetical protein
MSELISNLWACVDCMILEANGEMPTDREPTEPNPLSLVGEGFHVSLGMLMEEHQCGRTDWHDGEECYCEVRTFSTSSCDTCGSYLAGERHAMTLWRDTESLTYSNPPKFAGPVMWTPDTGWTNENLPADL